MLLYKKLVFIYLAYSKQLVLPEEDRGGVIKGISVLFDLAVLYKLAVRSKEWVYPLISHTSIVIESETVTGTGK